MNKASLKILLILLGLSSFAIAPRFQQEKRASSLNPVLLLNNTNLDEFLRYNPKGAQKIFLKMDVKAIIKNANGFIRINQSYDEVDIYGSQIVYHIQNGRILSRDGRISDIEIDSIVPNISMEQAKEIANEQISTKGEIKGSLKILPMKEDNYLVWHLEESSTFSRWHSMVNAHTGEIMMQFQGLTTGTGQLSNGKNVSFKTSKNFFSSRHQLKAKGLHKISTYSTHFDSEDKPVLPGSIGTSPDDKWPDTAMVDAHYYASEFVSLLLNNFERHSFDNNGATIISTVHYAPEEGEAYANAFWNGSQMVYGDGGIILGRTEKDDKVVAPLSGALDVIAHEISHAITEKSSSLIYLNESGALNEAFSDILGTYAEYKIQGDRFDWNIGEDIWDIRNPLTALRYMNDPTRDKSSSDYYPEKFPLCEKLETEEDWLKCMKRDNGGVHLNSGIANLMFYLLSEGGSHPRRKTRIRVRGLGIEKATQYVFKAFTQKLVATSTFHDARMAMIKVAREQRASVFEIQSIQDAWSAVGVN